jgi:outer membrane lipoprotein carrier protein
MLQSGPRHLGPYDCYTEGVTRILCFLVLLPWSLAGSTDTKTVVSAMEARYRSAGTVQATFLQTYTENGRLTRSEAGTAYFRRPGKMRWEYESPEKSLFLVDGKTAWFYVPADRTVTRVPARQSQDLRTPLALLAGEMKVSRVCARLEPSNTERPLSENDAVVRCVLRGVKNQVSRDSGEDGEVFIEIVRASGELARLVIRQDDGIQVEFRFENWRFNPLLPDVMFRFDPPPGVVIVNGELPGGEVPVK